MAARPALVVSRSEDRVVVMLPEVADDFRVHAIVSEDEAYCASNAIRRMIQSRDQREIVLGSETAGLLLARSNSHAHPVELILVDEAGETVVLLTKDDAATVADMLWAAHRTGAAFHGMVSLSGRIERRETDQTSIVPRPDAAEIADARLLGEISRRMRAHRPDARR